MMPPTDPERLATLAEDPLLKKLLRAAEHDVASEAQLAEVLAKLGPALDAAGGGSAAASTVAAKTTFGGAKWLAVVGLGVATLAPIAWVASRSGEGPTSTSTLNITGRSPGGTQSSHVDGSDRTLVTPTSTPTPTPDAVLPRQPSVSTTRLASPSASAPRADVAPTEPLEPEVRVLQRAQDALGREPARALALCDELARRGDGALLDQEREVIAIDALKRLGRMSDARSRAKRFRAAHPTSSHLGRLEVLVGRDF